MDIHHTLAEWADQGRRFALAVVLRADGSTPAPAGTKALLLETGEIVGTIGGGWVEATAQACAADVVRSGEPRILEIDLEGHDPGGDDPLCGGRMRVLLDPTAAKDRAAYARAAQARRQREPGVLQTTVHRAAPLRVEVAWLGEGAFPGSEPARAHPRPGAPERYVTEAAGGGEGLREPILPQPRLVIVGGGHIGQALAHQAAAVDFEIVVLDDRPEFTRAELFPTGAVLRCGDLARELAAWPLDCDTYVVVVTRGHQCDALALAACLSRPAAYLGMIGSRRKVALIRQELVATGQATATTWERVFAPIGLDIGAVTVPEIATSITAQLIAVRRGRLGPERSPAH